MPGRCPARLQKKPRHCRCGLIECALDLIVDQSGMTEKAPLSKREARKQQIRQRILDAAYELFLNNGFEETKIEDIMAQADVSRRTFYAYFPSKQDLLHVFSQHRLALTHERMLGYTDNRWSAARRIQTYFLTSAENMRDMGDFAKLLLREALDSSPSVLQPAGSDSMTTLVLEAYIEMLRSDYDKGLLDTKFDLAFLAEIVHGIHCSIVINWLKEPDYPVYKNMRQAAELAVKAISANK